MSLTTISLLNSTSNTTTQWTTTTRPVSTTVAVTGFFSSADGRIVLAFLIIILLLLMLIPLIVYLLLRRACVLKEEKIDEPIGEENNKETQTDVTGLELQEFDQRRQRIDMSKYMGKKLVEVEAPPRWHQINPKDWNDPWTSKFAGKETNYIGKNSSRENKKYGSDATDNKMTSRNTTRNAFFSRNTTDSFFGNPNKNAIRPVSPASVSSSDSDEEKLTKDQHVCINNLGMAAAFFLPIALICAAVGMGTKYWFNIQHYYVGLFQRCDNWTQICQPVSKFYDENTDTDKMKTTWAIGVPLLFGGVGILFIGLGALACYPCHRKVNFSKVACAVTIGIILLLGFLAFGGGFGLFALYAASNPNDATVMWSFFCVIGGAVFSFFTIVLFWVHLFYTGCFE